MITLKRGGMVKFRRTSPDIAKRCRYMGLEAKGAETPPRFSEANKEKRMDEVTS
jgi:hypothetical protein